jgi:hypothetical protein
MVMGSILSISRGPFVEDVTGAVAGSSRQDPARSRHGGSDMTQYLLSVWHDDDYDPTFDPDDADQQRLFTQVDAVNKEMEAAGVWVFGGGLHPASSATVVRPSSGGVSMTDGPYAESKEQMGGFWVIEASDLDAALDWARKAAAACEGPVEVRPFQGE